MCFKGVQLKGNALSDISELICDRRHFAPHFRSLGENCSKTPTGSRAATTRAVASNIPPKHAIPTIFLYKPRSQKTHARLVRKGTVNHILLHHGRACAQTEEDQFPGARQTIEPTAETTTKTVLRVPYES
jgi:hypothetical protein